MLSTPAEDVQRYAAPTSLRVRASDLKNDSIAWDAFHFLCQFGALINSVDALIFFFFICNTKTVTQIGNNYRMFWMYFRMSWGQFDALDVSV